MDVHRCAVPNERPTVLDIRFTVPTLVFAILGRVLLVGALASVGIELAQIAFSVIGGTRTADVDDVIATTLGGGVGLAVATDARHTALVRHLLPRPSRHRCGRTDGPPVEPVAP